MRRLVVLRVGAAMNRVWWTLGLLGALSACGDIKVGGNGKASTDGEADADGQSDSGVSTTCETDNDCTSDDACLEGSCNDGKCVERVQLGWCYEGSTCYKKKQQLAGDPCQVCDGATFIAQSCPTGQECDPENGQCISSAGDDVADSTIEGTDATDAVDGGLDSDGTSDGLDSEDGTSDATDSPDGTDGVIDSDGSAATTDVVDSATDTTDTTDTTDSTDATDATDGTSDSTDSTDGVDGSDGPVACSKNSDCAGLKTPCETAICVGDQCIIAAFDAGTPCIPDDVQYPSCFAGTCDDSATCLAVPKPGAPCDDNDLCTLNDVCGEGSCAGSAKDCADGNSCTANTCNGETGNCVAVPLDAMPCEDGNACTSDDACVIG